jgi:hypothetical protein
MANLNDFFYTDGIDDVTADKINALLGATLRAEYRNVETISATRALTDADTPIQVLTPSGADRAVNLPTVGVDNHPFFVINAGGSNDLLVGGGLADLGPGESALFFSDGQSWHVVSSLPAAGYINEQGAIPIYVGAAAYNISPGKAKVRGKLLAWSSANRAASQTPASSRPSWTVRINSVPCLSFNCLIDSSGLKMNLESCTIPLFYKELT